MEETTMIPKCIEESDVLAYLETNYPELVKDYEIDSCEFVRPSGKMYIGIRVHKPEFIAFPNKNLRLRDDDTCITIEHDCFSLTLWKDHVISHLSIMPRINEMNGV